jgi:hypothetical protein
LQKKGKINNFSLLKKINIFSGGTVSNSAVASAAATAAALVAGRESPNLFSNHPDINSNHVIMNNDNNNNLSEAEFVPLLRRSQDDHQDEQTDNESEKRTRSVSSSPLHNNSLHNSLGQIVPNFRRMSSQPDIDVSATATASRARTVVSKKEDKNDKIVNVVVASSSSNAAVVVSPSSSSSCVVGVVADVDDVTMDERARAVLTSLRQEKSKSEALEQQVAALQSKTENLMQSVQERDEVILQLKQQMEELLEAVKNGSFEKK